MNKLQKRLHNDHGWLVTAKALMTFHRLMRECDTGFQDQLLSYMDSAGRRRLLRIDNYKDRMHNNTWDVSSWIRVYSTYLDERLNFYRELKHDVNASPDADSIAAKLSEKSVPELIEALGCLQRMVDAICDCVPEGEARQHDVSVASAALVAKEASNAFEAAHEGALSLAERLRGVSSPSEATAALELLRRASELHGSAAAYKRKVEAQPDLSRGARLADPCEPPAEMLKAAEEHVAGLVKASRTSSRAATSAAGAVLTKAQILSSKSIIKPSSAPQFTNVQVLAPGIAKATAAPEVNLLADLDLGPPTPATKPSQPDKVLVTAHQADPFGIHEPSPNFAVTFDGPIEAPKPIINGASAFGTSNANANAPWPQSPDPFAAPSAPTAAPLSPTPNPPSQFIYASAASTMMDLGSPAPSGGGSARPLGISSMLDDPFGASSAPITPNPVSQPKPNNPSMLMDDLFGTPMSPSPTQQPQQRLNAFSPIPQPFSAPATNNPFSPVGAHSAATPFEGSSSYYTPQKPVSNPFAHPSPLGPPGALSGEALSAAGLSPTMVASAMAKSSLTDPFADLTGMGKAASSAPLARGSAMKAMKA